MVLRESARRSGAPDCSADAGLVGEASGVAAAVAGRGAGGVHRLAGVARSGGVDADAGAAAGTGGGGGSSSSRSRRGGGGGRSFCGNSVQTNGGGMGLGTFSTPHGSRLPALGLAGGRLGGSSSSLSSSGLGDHGRSGPCRSMSCERPSSARTSLPSSPDPPSPCGRRTRRSAAACCCGRQRARTRRPEVAGLDSGDSGDWAQGAGAGGRGPAAVPACWVVRQQPGPPGPACSRARGGMGLVGGNTLRLCWAWSSAFAAPSLLDLLLAARPGARHGLRLSEMPQQHPPGSPRGGLERAPGSRAGGWAGPAP